MASRKRRKLPSGWELRTDSYSNKSYYIDHNTQTTHWTPPPPNHALPPPPSNASVPHRNGHTKRVRHRRSSTLDDICSITTPAPPPPSLFRNPSKSVTHLHQRRTQTKLKPRPPPIHHRKRAITNRRAKSHKPQAPPPPYNTTHNMAPPPPPRQLPSAPIHSSPCIASNKAQREETRRHPLQRSTSFDDIPPPPPLPLPPPPSHLEVDNDSDSGNGSEIIPKSQAMRWMHEYSRSANVLQNEVTRHSSCNLARLRSIESSESSGMHLCIDIETSSHGYVNTYSKHNNNTIRYVKSKPSTPNGGDISHHKYRKKKKRKKKKMRKHARSPTFSACDSPEYFKYKGKSKSNTNTNKTSKWNEKTWKLRQSIKKTIRKTKDDLYAYDEDDININFDDDEIAFKLTANRLTSTVPTNQTILMASALPSSSEEDKKLDTNEANFYTLSEIVERVTSPSVRGTQDQSVLLYTYSLYTTQRHLLRAILDRLSYAWRVGNNQMQIKVLSLLKQWVKTENDFMEEREEENRISHENKHHTIANGISLLPSSTPELPTAEDSDSLYAYDVNMPQRLKKEESINRNEVEPFTEYFKKELTLVTRHCDMLQRLSKPILSQLASLSSPVPLVRTRTLSFADAPSSIVPRAKSAMDLELIRMDATEVARQICLAEYDIFKRIKFCEFLQQKSRKKAQKEKENVIANMNAQVAKANTDHNFSERQLQKHAKLKENIVRTYDVNIDKMTDWFNRLVVWTQIEILYQRDDNKRCKTLGTLLNICDKLEQYNNISSLCAIRAGLCSAPIHRLTKTWRNLSKKHREIKANIDELFKLGNGQKSLRDRVAIISQPAIPHLGLFMADIMFIHDGNHTFETDNNEKINWTKMKLLHDRIHWIYMFQQAPFIFLPVPIINEYLHSKMKIVNEDFLYRLSREVEPPPQKK